MEKVASCIRFLDSSPEPFHVVKTVIGQLSRAGFIPIDEGQVWSSLLRKGGKYYFTRNGSSIVAFTVGKSSCSFNAYKSMR